ncbi:hypothetical protein [Synechococcus sp. 1G10]|uniref:hypothetical protein n=1 Tax=Synechococcus sp. 1G10 TaxID=2025605 RepID=UPI000B995A65|nr:hypothetical protein [Synechococcus sp. 1G10]
MNRFLTSAAAAAIAITASPAYAQPTPAIVKQCQTAADFAGCVKAFTTPAVVKDEVQPLRDAMKQVAARLTTGTSLADSTSVYQPVVDQLALVESAHGSDPAVVAARKATNMFGVMRSAWGLRIQADVSHKLNKSNVYICPTLKDTADIFDQQFETSINFNYSTTWAGRLFGVKLCTVADYQLPDYYMRSEIVQVLNSGATPTTSMEKGAPSSTKIFPQPVSDYSSGFR